MESNTEATELDLLKERADMMGITYHPSIGVDKLKSKLAGDVDSPRLTKRESIPQRNARLRREANKQVRIRVTCMNPAKKNWQGETFSMSNSAIGWIKKYVLFEAEDGYHIPHVLLGIIQNKKYQAFDTVVVNGKKIKRPKLVKEFAIEILPDLTIPELQDLATRQALNNSADI